MKKLFILATLTGVLASQAMALEVNLSRAPGYFTIPGGEFTVTTVNPDPAFDAIFKNYAPVATLGGGFQTFCLGLTTELLGNPQLGTLSSAGVSKGSALLYFEFGHGALAGYDYVAGSGRAASAAQLQSAIWYFQGFTQAQINGEFGSPVFDPTTDTFVLAAEAALGGLSGAQAPNAGALGVDAVELTSLTGAISQPMLALVPDGASTIMLLGFALSGIGVVSRKLRA